MTDYTPTFDGATKDGAAASGLAADMDQDFTDIETAIASKVETVSAAVSGNLIESDANGKMVDSGVPSSYLTGLTGDAQAQIDALVDIEADISNWKRAGNFYMRSAAVSQTPFDISAGVTQSTHETLGDSTSGATNTWSELDVLPSTTRLCLFAIQSNWLQRNALTEHDLELHIYKGDETNKVTDETKVMSISEQNYGAAANMQHSDYVIVPCSDAQLFKIYWSTNATTGQLKLHLKGFWVD